MAGEFRQYSEPPPGSSGAPDAPDPRTNPRFYQVVQGDEVVAAYDAAHYPSLDDVVADLLARGDAGEAAGDRGEVYHIWRAGRRVGMIRGRDAPPARGPNTDPATWGESGHIRIAESPHDDYRAA